MRAWPLVPFPLDAEQKLAARLARTRLLGAALEATALGGVLGGLLLRWGPRLLALGVGALRPPYCATHFSALAAVRL